MESRRVMTGSMDTGRFMLRQGGVWDANSALENYNGTRETDFRVGGAYGTRSFVEGGYPRENIYPRESFHRDPPFLEREGYEVPPPVYGMWPGGRHSTMEEELMTTRSSQRYEKVSHVDNYREHDNYRETGKIRHDDSFREHSKAGDVESYSSIDRYSDVDGFRERGYDRSGRYAPHDRDRYDDEDSEYYRSRRSRGSHEGSRDRDHDHSRHGEHDSDYERGKREHGRHRHRERERGRRGRSREQDRSLDRERHRERSRSYSNDDHGWKSRSPHGHGRGRRESSQEEARYEARSEKNGRKRDRDRDGRRTDDRYQVAPSATLVVKGLSQKTVDDDLYEALKDWGPLRHVRVIREKSSGISRGFAFVDFPSVEAAEKTMEGIGHEGMVVDGRRLFLEYSSKPTGSVGGLQGGGSTTPGLSKTTAPAPADWTCAICACVNFARRMSCFQCNEARTEDALPGDMALGYSAAAGKKGAEGGLTHVLVLRGLDEHINEDDLHHEFSKYALIKDLRLVRDKFTNVSRGFAFIHFHSVDDASKALEASNGRTLEKKGQILRVAYAKSIHGPGPNAGSSVASSLAATAIEAANFAQQYNSSGWAPKQYSLNQDGGTQGVACEGGQSAVAILNGYSVDGGAPHSGFVWDEASGYYYDAASGFYYDGHRGLYYDGNNGIWYTYSQEAQKYVPYVDQTAELENKGNKVEEASDEMNTIITKTKSEITNEEDTPAAEKAPSLPEAVQAAAIAAQAANKKEKKEIRLASKGMLLASKKKISNAMNLWKQRKQEGGATLAVPAADERQSVVVSKINSPAGIEDKQETAPVSCSSSGFPSLTLHLPTTAVKKIDAPVYSNTPTRLAATSFSATHQSSEIVTLNNRETPSGLVSASGRGTERVIEPCVEINLSTATTSFKTDVSALGSYGTSAGAGSRRRFSEIPLSSSYRDRAAERRSLYGSSALSDVTMDSETSDRGREMPFPPGVGGRGRGADMPFPPGVGAKSVGSAVLAGPEMQSYEVITLEKAIDETNVGNRMLRNMGWQEGLGLGKDGSGIVEPLQAQSTGERAGLGSQSQRKLDARFETQPGDTYKIAIQRKALARFHDMM